MVKVGHKMGIRVLTANPLDQLTGQVDSFCASRLSGSKHRLNQHSVRSTESLYKPVRQLSCSGNLMGLKDTPDAPPRKPVTGCVNQRPHSCGVMGVIIDPCHAVPVTPSFESPPDPRECLCSSSELSWSHPMLGGNGQGSEDVDRVMLPPQRTGDVHRGAIWEANG